MDKDYKFPIIEKVSGEDYYQLTMSNGEVVWRFFDDFDHVTEYYKTTKEYDNRFPVRILNIGSSKFRILN